jgi:hypothetical protein
MKKCPRGTFAFSITIARVELLQQRASPIETGVGALDLPGVFFACDIPRGMG